MNLFRKKKLFVVLLIALLTVSLVGLTGVAIVVDGLHDRIEPVDVAIVLGSAVDEHGEPSIRLRARLDKAAELYQRKLFKKVLVSGGVDWRGFDEAKIMAHYLSIHGVADSDILTDSGGRTTWHTAQNAVEILRVNDLHSAMAITQYFHISRTRLAFRHFGIDCPANAHADLFEPRDAYSTLREIVGYYAYWL